MMLDCFYVYLPARFDKQSDLESSGSILQGKKGETKPVAPMMPSVSKDPENGFRMTSTREEVNSHVKKSRVSKLPMKKSPIQKSHVQDLRCNSCPIRCWQRCTAL